MVNRCQGCGAKLAENAKLCPNCGKIVHNQSGNTQRRRPVNNDNSEFSQPKRVYEHRTNYPQQNVNAQRPVHSANQVKKPVQHIEQPAKNAVQSSRKQSAHKSSRGEATKKKGIKPFLKIGFIVVCIAVVICAVYGVVAFVKISSAKALEYDLGVSVGDFYDNFGDATENYFEDADWSYSLFSNTVTCTGTKKKDSYVLKFGSTDNGFGLKEIVKNEETIDEAEFGIVIMGLFMK